MILIGCLGIIAAVYFWYLDEQGNFHPITPGEAYRSAQLDQDELKYYIHKFDIHSIINLRGKNTGELWYRKEIATCKKLDLKHYDLGLSAGRKPSSREIKELLRLFKIAPCPVLIHCQGGADRSGLAAALWKMIIDGSPKSIAQEQLSIRFGHMPFGPTQALDVFLANWVVPTKTGADTKDLTKGFYKRGDYAAD
jgi:protein tyrosine/serine phosphatase